MRPLAPTPSNEAPVLALFDMDKTLLTANSASLWLAFERREERLTRLDMLRGLFWLLQYKLGVVDMDTVLLRAQELSSGIAVEVLEERTERWYQEMVRPTISEVGAARVEEHRGVGHQVAILTASTQFGATPVARELGIEDLICTRLEVGPDGRLTGRVEGDFCFGEGKLRLAEEYARSRRASLSDAWFYSDSYTDLPLLEAVGMPVAVNPDPRLKRHARRAGWQTAVFD